MDRDKGITLVALVLTIIIMIILATVAINYLFGENGLITKAQQAAEMSEIESVRERLEMAKGTAVIDGQGYIDPDNYFNILETEGIIGDKETDVIDNGDGTYEVVTVEGYIFIITLLPTPDEVRDLEIEYSGTAEGPRIAKLTTEWTTNSISIEVDARNAEGATYRYEYKLNAEANWQQAEESRNNTCTINNLTEGETYDIRVTVTTDEGSITRETSVYLGELPEGTITFGEVQWQGDGTASVVVNNSVKGYQLQYQVNAIEDNGWINIDSGYTISNLTYPSTVYARIFDGTNGSDHASVSLEDKTAPIVNVTSNGTTSNSVSVSATATDTQSGMVSSPTYTYSIKVTGQDDSTYNTPSGASNLSTNTYTFTGLTQGTNYTVRVVVNGDIAGNSGTGTLGDLTTGTIPGGEGDLEEGAITFGNTTWGTNTASITVSTNTSYTIEYQVNNVTEGDWTTISSGGTISNLSYGDTVYARLTDGNNYGDYASASIDDGIAPTVNVTSAGTTSNSVSVSATATDTQSGMIASPTYTYSIKVTGQDDSTYTTPEYASNLTSNTYTFTGLIQGTNYTVRVVVNGDVAGNSGTGTLGDLTTGTIPSGEGDGDLEEGAITFGSTTWGTNTANITVSTNTNYTIEYQVNNATEGSWTTIANGGTINNLSYGDTVYARLTDGNNHGDYASVSIDDGIEPTVNVTSTGTTSNSVSVRASATDTQSGMVSSPTYTYSIKVTGQDDSTYNTPSNAQNIAANSYTFIGLTQGTNYTVRVVVNGDVAGNSGTGTATNLTTGTVGGATGGLETGNIVASNPTWSSGQASITLTTTTGMQIQYQVNSTSGQWTTINSGGSVSGLNHGDTVYARLTDGNNYGDYASVNIQDGIAPSVPTIRITSGTEGNNGYYKSNVTVTITGGNDGESGTNKIRYAVTGAQTVTQTETADGTTSTSITISADGASTITAYTLDKANNVSKAATQTINKDSTAPSTASLTVGTVGETSIAVTARGTDSTSGIYSYQFQRSTTSSTSGFTTVATKTNTATSYSYTYNNLTAETTYYLRVVVTDRAGNTQTSTAVTQKTNKKIATNVNELKAGDYVYYTDRKGTRRTCVVLYDSSSSYGVEIITMESVEDVTLGSSTFSTGMNSYNNAISTLNSAASDYNNTTYSSRARCVGSVPNNINSQSGYHTTQFSSSYSDKLRDTDTNYTSDWNQMGTLGIRGIDEEYWLASRYVSSSSSNSFFLMRLAGDSGVLNYMQLCYVSSSDGTSSYSGTTGLRPVFLLKSNIKVTGGTGEEGDPYTLGT